MLKRVGNFLSVEKIGPIPGSRTPPSSSGRMPDVRFTVGFSVGGRVDLGPQSSYGGSMGHELVDEISLEMGRRVVVRLRQQPELLRIAHENLDRWSRLNASAHSLLRCYAEWRDILSRPLEEVCNLLSSDTEEARRLRQNSPFVGILSAQEVWELKQRFRHAATAT